MATITEQTNSAHLSAYKAEIETWRREIEERLRSETGWLTLTGLYWLHPGENTLGSDPVADVLLPESAPKQVGFIDFADPMATLRVTTDVPVTADGQPVKTVTLRHDNEAQGPTRIEISSVNFYLIKRGDQFGMRVRDSENPARKNFKGRVWFPVDPSYRVDAKYVPHPEVRTLDIMTVAGIIEPTENPGYVEFELAGHRVHLEAFSSKPNEVWLVFRDASPHTYRAARFLYAPLKPDGTAILDFNKAYNPPCAFTPYATCPLPPKENILPFKIEVGERALEDYFKG